MFDLGLVIAFAGIVGGRLWDVFFLIGNTIIIIYWKSPISGKAGWLSKAALFCVYCRIFYLKKHQIPVLPFADTVTPGIILGQAIGRIANFMNGDAFGHPTGQDFGLLYPDTTLAYHTYGAQPLWPAEVWECQGDLLIFVLLIWYGCKTRTEGTTFASISCFILSFASFLKITEAIMEHSSSV